MSAGEMVTKRKYAHELYPHADEYEVRELADEVPYLYARTVGLEVFDTDWHELWSPELKKADPERAELTIRLTSDRTSLLIAARQHALLADALLQGLSGQEAWEWAEERMDESGECVYERAEHYGVPIESIKPYPVVSESDHHRHYDAPDTRGWRTVHRIDGKESECTECCEATS